MTALSPRLTGDDRIGKAFAEGVASILTGRYHRLGQKDGDLPAAFHGPFLMDMIPRLVSIALDFKSEEGSGVFHIRDRARDWYENRWWRPHPRASYARFLTDLATRLELDDARYLALLADNYAPQDRDDYAVRHMTRLAQQSPYLPSIALPDFGTFAADFEDDLSLVIRRSFLDGYPLVIGNDAYLPNRRAGHYDAVRLRSLSRGYLCHPALVLRDGDARLSTLNQLGVVQRKL